IAEKIMEQQVPLQSATRPVTSYQREYYVGKNGCRYEYEPAAQIPTGKKQRSCEQNSESSTESYLTDQYDTTTASETEPASTSSEEADSESDLQNLSNTRYNRKSKQTTSCPISKNLYEFK
ncbi:hypothetical protein K3495_g17134, partial [Podosphaera aphanis]